MKTYYMVIGIGFAILAPTISLYQHSWLAWILIALVLIPVMLQIGVESNDFEDAIGSTSLLLIIILVVTSGIRYFFIEMVILIFEIDFTINFVWLLAYVTSITVMILSLNDMLEA